MPIRQLNRCRRHLVKFFAFLLGFALALFSIPALSQAGEIPVHPPAEKGALIFSDDFSTNRFGSTWTERIKSAGVEDGVMFGRQTTTEHGSVASAKLDLPDGDLICECRVQLR